MKRDEPCVFPGMGPQTQLSYLGAGGGGFSKAKEQSAAVPVNSGIMGGHFS